MSHTKKDDSVESRNETVEPLVVAASLDSADEPAVVMTVDNENVADTASTHHTAEFVNPTDYEDYWRNHFYAAPYYVSGCVWSDYRPAYRLGFDAYFSNHGHAFDDVETAVARSWEVIKDKSNLTWSQARNAVRDGWQFVESAVSGSSGRSVQ